MTDKSVSAVAGEDHCLCALRNSSIGEEAAEPFICNHCKRPIKQTFQVAADNRPYCVQCFADKFNPKCAGCDEVLVDHCLMARDKHWHTRCFTCTLCRRPFPNGKYFLVDDKPYDLDCHWAKRLDKQNQMSRENHRNLVVDDQ